MKSKLSLFLFLLCFVSALFGQEALYPPQAARCGPSYLGASADVARFMLGRDSVTATLANSRAERDMVLGTQGGAALLPTTITGVDATSDQTVDAVLPAGFRLSGMLIGGPKLLIANVRAQGKDGRTFSGSADLFTRQYRIVVPAGTYTLTVCFFPEFPGSTTVGFDDPTPVEVSADTSHDITLPKVTLYNVTGTISGLDPRFEFRALSFASADARSGGIFQLADDGSYQARLPDGEYSVALIQTQSAEGQSWTSNLGSVSVSGSDTVADFAVPPAATLSGVVSSPDFPEIPPNSSVFAVDVSGPVITGAACVAPLGDSGSGPISPSGEYQTVLTSGGTYRVLASIQLGQGAGSVIFLVPDPIQVIGKATEDITLPPLPGRVTISGRVTDPNGNGVANGFVTASTQQVTDAPNITFSNSTQTDSEGNYALSVLSGTNYTLGFSPPQF